MCAIPHSAFTTDGHMLHGTRIGRSGYAEKTGRGTWVSVIGGHPLGDTKMDGYLGGWILLKFVFSL